MPDILSPELRSLRMAQIKGTDNKIEMIVRKYLFHNGYRYRINVSSMPGKPDIVLSKYKTVIFINGCYWHRHFGCKYAQTPKSNIDFWESKFKRNVENDQRNYSLLENAGWNIIVLWECDIKKNFDLTMQKLKNELQDNLIDRHE